MGSPLADQQQRSLQENNRDQGFLSYGSRTRPAHHSLPPLVDPVVTTVPKGKHFTRGCRKAASISTWVNIWKVVLILFFKHFPFTLELRINIVLVYKVHMSMIPIKSGTKWNLDIEMTSSFHTYWFHVSTYNFNYIYNVVMIPKFDSLGYFSNSVILI